MSDEIASLIDDLIHANRILEQKGVLDTFGHVSIRSPNEPKTFYMVTMRSPSQCTKADVLHLSIATADPVSPQEKRQGNLERFIHSGVYQTRPEVVAVLHCHAPLLVSYSILPTPALQPALHVGASTGKHVPIYDIAAHNGRSTDLLIKTPELGEDFARVFKRNPASNMVLMRGHGATIVSTRSVRDLVHKGIYAVTNAQIIKDAKALAGPNGEIQYLSEGEVDACSDWVNAVHRSWPAWVAAIKE